MTNVTVTFGLDFGTSKTVITRAQVGSINPVVVDLAIDGQADRIATCVLRDKATGRVYIGTKADQEYRLLQDAEQRNQLEFFANFKPRIHRNAADKEAAKFFLTEIRHGERLTSEFAQYAGQSIVAAGCPVGWMSDGAATLVGLLYDAEFPPAFAIPEPVGAAFYFLGVGLKAQDFHHDVVVFDWGAGTFDMTVLRAGRLEFEGSETWGSNLYGGRLFDDLFFQWMIEIAERAGHGDDVRKLAARPIERNYLHGAKARQIKESFSRFYSTNDPAQPWIWEFPVVIGAGAARVNLGDFVVEHIGEFADRMKAYRASDLALRWFDAKTDDVQPEEAGFVAALRAGKEVDLGAWGRMMIEVGLRKLGIHDGATAILTGGSCNWKWFGEHVRGVAPFAGRPTSVLSDDKPELTIARGLARVYAVGSYSKQLVDHVGAARQVLRDPLTKAHAELLEKLSYLLTSLMKADDNLQAEIRTIFTEAMNRAGAAQPTKKDYKELARAFVGNLMKDQSAETIRPELERSVARWVDANRAKVQRQSERFSLEAYQRIMEVLKQQVHAEIGGFVEVAIEACGATGATKLDEALKQLGRRIKFEPNMVLRLYDETAKLAKNLISNYVSKTPVTEDRDAAVQKEVAASMDRFFLALPGAIRKNISEVQSAQSWSDQVIDHLVATLQTLVRIARVDEANRLAVMAPAGTAPASARGGGA